MQTKKPKFLMFIFLGAIIGSALASWLAPKGIAWYFDPPVDIGVNCKSATEWAMNRLRTMQIVGLGVGAVFGLILAIVVKRRRNAVSYEYTTPADPR